MEVHLKLLICHACNVNTSRHVTTVLVKVLSLLKEHLWDSYKQKSESQNHNDDVRRRVTYIQTCIKPYDTG